ncbi:MAG TPA: hypothetical protein VHD56_07610 [Tepidisphaeraceae bacterium]|nr:hypothetical protein [Tepidisphaeraceae bacterium]
MSFVLLLPVILSLLVLAAHFLHAGNLVMVVACLLLPWLLLVRKSWTVRVIQIVLVLAAFEWLRTMVVLMNERQVAGEPWIRMVIILGAVMLFTVASGLVFAAPKLKRRYFDAGTTAAFPVLVRSNAD